MSASRMEKDLVFAEGLYQVAHETLPTGPSVEGFF